MATFSQYKCYNGHGRNYNRNQQITSELGGFYSNAYVLQPQNFQLETNIFIGNQKVNGSQQTIFLSASQIRYGLVKRLEIDGGLAFFLNPVEESMYSEYYIGNIGGKFQILEFKHKNVESRFAVKAHYVYNHSDSGIERTSSHGYVIQITGSINFVGYANIDASYGLVQYPAEGLPEQIFNARLSLKNSESNVGVFIGNHQNLFTETLFNMGFILTDNYRWISHVAFGLIDNMGALNLSLTYNFRH